MPSINDVAKLAGVSKSTVSKVLNNYKLVSEATRLKVEKAVEELDYVPNSMAVSLSKQKLNRVGLIVDIQHNSQFIDEIGMKYLKGAFDKSQEYGIDVVTFFSAQFQGMTKDQVKSYLLSQSVDSLIFYNLGSSDGNLVDLIHDQAFDCVVIDSPIVNERTSSINIDHYQAQYEVAKKTISENEFQDKVLYIAGEQGSYVGSERLRALEALKLDLGFDLRVEYGDFKEYMARKITFDYGADVEVIVCASDMMAIGSIFALIKMDIFKPVCGFDGITLMGYASIEMNTVQQWFYNKSQCAFDELKRLIDGGKGRSLMLPYELCNIKYMDVIHQPMKARDE